MSTTERAGPLHGFAIAVTAHRRGAELADLLQSRGADVIHAPAITEVATPSDPSVLAATVQCIQEPPDLLIVTTSFGIHSWLAAADSWGLGEQLRSALETTTIHARGLKSLAAVQAVGLHSAVTTDGGVAATTREIVAGLVTARSGEVVGKRIVIQASGETFDGLSANLIEAGADVDVVRSYRWEPCDPAGIDRVLRMASQGSLDAIVFTSRPAVAALIDQAAASLAGGVPALLAALRSSVVPYCIGPTTARPLRALGISAVESPEPRFGTLVHTVTEHLPLQHSIALVAAGHSVEIQGQLVRVDGTTVEISPGPMAVLKALAERPGHVVSRPELRAATHAEDGSDDHAIEVTVARLRHALGHHPIVQTVVKRGYRLATT